MPELRVQEVPWGGTLNRVQRVRPQGVLRQSTYGIRAFHFAILQTARNRPQESLEMGKIQLLVL